MEKTMTHQDFLEIATQLVEEYALGKTGEQTTAYIVWSCKTLQNSKALLSTPISDSRYYEVTLNGDKNEIYFDSYMKEKNKCYTFERKV